MDSDIKIVNGVRVITRDEGRDKGYYVNLHDLRYVSIDNLIDILAWCRKHNLSEDKVNHDEISKP
jgi:hypothetical protein